MYASTHGLTGAAIVVATFGLTGSYVGAMAAGGFLAFLSHDPLDRVGEYPYGGLRETLIWEAVPFIAFCLLAYVSGHWELLAVGWIAGNGMDIIDKKAYLAMIFPDRIKPLNFFAAHKRAPSVLLTARQTKMIAVAVTIFSFVLAG